MVRLTDRPDMTLDVYRGRKTTQQQQQQTLQVTGYLVLKIWIFRGLWHKFSFIFWHGLIAHVVINV